MAPTSRRSDLIDQHDAIAERIRKLEVMRSSKVLTPRRWKPTDDQLDVIVRVCAAYSEWLSPGVGGDEGNPTPLLTLNRPASYLVNRLVDPTVAWYSEEFCRNFYDFWRFVGVLPTHPIMLQMEQYPYSHPNPVDERDVALGQLVPPPSLTGREVSPFIFANGFSTYSKRGWYTGLAHGRWVFHPYGEPPTGNGLNFYSPGAYDPDGSPVMVEEGTEYERELEPAGTYAKQNRGFYGAAVPVDEAEENGGWPTAYEPTLFDAYWNTSAYSVFGGPEGGDCNNPPLNSNVPQPDTSGGFRSTPFPYEWECAANPGTQFPFGGHGRYFVWQLVGAHYLCWPPEADAQQGPMLDGSGVIDWNPPYRGPSPSYPGWQEARRRVAAGLVLYPYVAEWFDRYMEQALTEDAPRWQTLQHVLPLRGRVEARVLDKTVHLRGTLTHPFSWNGLAAIGYFSQAEVPPPANTGFLQAYTERGDVVGLVFDRLHGDYEGLWVLYLNQPQVSETTLSEGGSLVFDTVSWPTDDLLY
jgi:hypothetical protein